MATDPKAAEKAAARRSFLAFCRYTFPTFQTNWHHRQIADLVDQMLVGQLPRLVLCMPPRYGKSEMLSRRLPAYLFGRNPDAQVIATSYAADLASRINRDVQRVIDSQPYRDLFPDTRLFGKNIRSVAGGSYLRNSEIFEIVDHAGSYRAAGVNGGITGMGFGRLGVDPDAEIISGVGIIDDPFKNRKEAESITVQEAVWDWYTSTFRTRAEGDSAILLVNTRWNKKDLAGRLIKLAESDPKADQWVVVSFEAIRTEGDDRPYDPRQPGEALWVQKDSLDALLGIKASVGPYDWSALFQQSPTPDQASIFQRDWCECWYELPTFDRVVVSVHANFKKASSAEHVTIQVWGKAGEQFYLLDQQRDRMTYLAAKSAVLEIVERWQEQGITVNELLIEDKRNGKAILESLAASSPVTVTPTDFNGDTDQGRAQAIAAFFAAGDVFIPAKAPWADGFVDELGDFPGSETTNQVGAMSQALIYLALRAQTGFVFEFFNRAAHTLRGADELDFALDPSLDLHLSFDFNRHPATCLVGQVHGNDLIILREFYLLESNTFELAETVCKWVVESGQHAKIYIYGDASGNSKTANAQETNWQIVWAAIKRYGLKRRATKRYGDANPRVRDTVISVNYLFKVGRLYILLSQCPELVKDMEQLVWKGDEIDKSDLMRSHEGDNLRYLVHTLYSYKQQIATKGRGNGTQRALPGLAV